MPLSDGREVEVDVAWDMSSVPLNYGGNDSQFDVEFGIDRHFADRCLTLNNFAHQQWRVGSPGTISGTAAGLDIDDLFLELEDLFIAGRSVFHVRRSHPRGLSGRLARTFRFGRRATKPLRMESATFREILRLDAQEMIVRQPIALRSRARRAPDERVFLRLPSVVALACRVVWRLSPRSRVRQAFIRRGAQLGFDALNRGDFRSSFFVLYDPNVEFITPPRLVGLGFDPVYHGREGRVRFQKRWMDEWGEMRFEPEEVFDLGDGLLFLGRVEGSGVSSGAAFASEQWGVLYEASAGRVIREEPFFDRREALEAAGLHE